MTEEPLWRLDGQSASRASIIDIGYGAPIEVPAEGIAAVVRAQKALHNARETGVVYGADTGVGANREIAIPARDVVSGEHAMRLLRSHCMAVGEQVPDHVARSAMAVRLNQLVAGGSGISPVVVQGLIEAIRTDSIPPMHEYGGIGTGDLSVMAELGLTLAGELPWLRGGIEPIRFDDTDALPLMSSNALTIATACHGLDRWSAVLDASMVVAAMTLMAAEGSTQAYDPRIASRRPHAQQERISRRMSLLLDSVGSGIGSRLQDPFGLRVVPQIAAVALDGVERCDEVLCLEINSASENPLFVDGEALHHGQFQLATLAAVLDSVRTSSYAVVSLSAARIGMMMKSDITGLARFLAAGPPGSSGLLISEYIAQDAVARIRPLAFPNSAVSVNISIGLEEHASFASQGARFLGQIAEIASVVLAVEAVAAVRALRLAPDRLRDCPARTAFDFLEGSVAMSAEDRPTGLDVETVRDQIYELADIVRILD